MELKFNTATIDTKLFGILRRDQCNRILEQQTLPKLRLLMDMFVNSAEYVFSNDRHNDGGLASSKLVLPADISHLQNASGRLYPPTHFNKQLLIAMLMPKFFDARNAHDVIQTGMFGSINMRLCGYILNLMTRAQLLATITHWKSGNGERVVVNRMDRVYN